MDKEYFEDLKKRGLITEEEYRAMTNKLSCPQWGLNRKIKEVVETCSSFIRNLTKACSSFIRNLTKKQLVIAGSALIVVVSLLAIVIALVNKPSEGLVYKKHSEYEAYVVAGIGSCKDSNIIIPSEYKGLPVVGIGDDAFNHCTTIKSVKIPDGVTSIGDYAFSDCTSLKSITIPDSVERIGYYAFSDCTSLKSLTIPDSVVWGISSTVFDGCTSLMSINVDNNSKYKVIDGNFYTKDGKTFVRYYALGKKDTSFTIPDSVTSIDYGAFYGCTSLTSVTIPDSVTSIGSSAFSGCTSLRFIYYNGTKAQWDSISKGYFWNSGISNYIIFCTDGSMYK